MVDNTTLKYQRIADLPPELRGEAEKVRDALKSIQAIDPKNPGAVERSWQSL
jgi:hypothetical protein